MKAEDAINHPWFRKAQRGELSQADSILVDESVKALRQFHAGSRLKQAIHSFFTANLLSANELQTLSEQFRAFDKNGNGRLSKDELLEGFRTVRGIDFSEADIDELIARVDVDGSGDIDYNEFIEGAVMGERLITDERLENAFRLFDANGDNMISMMEIKGVLDQWKDVDEQLIDKAMKEIVRSKNSQLSYQDFKTFIKKLFA